MGKVLQSMGEMSQFVGENPWVRCIQSMDEVPQKMDEMPHQCRCPNQRVRGTQSMGEVPPSMSKMHPINGEGATING